jgi:hypothetical protein
MLLSLDTPVSSTNSTDCHVITEILLKVELNTHNHHFINLRQQCLCELLYHLTYVSHPSSVCLWSSLACHIIIFSTETTGSNLTKLGWDSPSGQFHPQVHIFSNQKLVKLCFWLENVNSRVELSFLTFIACILWRRFFSLEIKKRSNYLLAKEKNAHRKVLYLKIFKRTRIL